VIKSQGPFSAPRPLSPGASSQLDWIRTVAAWAVMWSHLRALFFEDLPAVHSKSLFIKFFYLVTGFGHQSVIVFFVLSGFLVSSAVLARLTVGKLSLVDYGIDRLSRLGIVLIPGLLLGYIWDRSGLYLFGHSGLYSRPIEAIGGAIVVTRMSFTTFLGNALFLQNILCPPFGSNGPLWSLTNEFWYYVLFPLLLLSSVATIARKWKSALGYFLIAMAAFLFLTPEIRRDFLIWLSGCALVFLYARTRLLARRTAAIVLLAGSIGLCGALGATRILHNHEFASNLLLGVVFTGFLYGILQCSKEVPNRVYANAAKQCAGFSFSLYVLHFPFLLVLKGWLAPIGRWQPDTHHMVDGLLISGAVLGFAWCGSLVTERNTDFVRHWLKARLQRKAPRIAWSPLPLPVPPQRNDRVNRPMTTT
jgi:peptidoglycan/LPS O-acetylase OafA/YrhL